jgi:GntR family transcriptional regulator, rspAB operon transcriptional repressor
MGRASEDNSLSTKAYTILRHRILRGELPLGGVISRRKIAVELGMSLLPVMEALVRLEFEGLLESRPRAGTRVRIPTREDVIGHSVVREALEGQAARLVASHATPAERESLLKLAVRVDAAQNSDQVQFATLHQRFHMRVVECTHVPALLKAIESTQALHSIWLCARVPRLPEHSRGNREHQDLAKVLTEGTPEEAEAEMRQHVARGFHQIMDGLEPFFKIRKLRGESYSRTAPKNSLSLTTA